MIVVNRKATYEFEIVERYEGGIILLGWEVKAIRAGKAQLAEAYVRLIGGAPWLVGCHITPLIFSQPGADPTRSRKLLLRKEEIQRLVGKVEQKGFTLVPLNLHYKHGFIKLEIGLAKGKKLHDKRQTIKDRELDREARREKV
jgi:SsrA-binding protein